MILSGMSNMQQLKEYIETFSTEKPLDEAFLNARNRNRLKFAVMWANHNWGLWPALDDDEHQAMNGNVNQSSNLFLKITHSEQDLRNVVDFCSEKYFRLENYWKIDGKPVYSFFSSDRLFESVPPADVVRIMNEQAEKNGFPGIYLLMNIGCCNDNARFCGWGRVPKLKEAGFDAVFAYNIVAPSYYREIPPERPVFDYSGMIEAQEFCWGKIEEGGLPHFPSVTIGLDVSPRWSRSVRFPMDFLKLGYCPICTGNTPEKFGEVLKKEIPFLGICVGMQLLFSGSEERDSFVMPDTVSSERIPPPEAARTASESA